MSLLVFIPKTLCTTSIIEHSFSSSGEYCLKSTYAALPFIKYNLIYNGLLKKSILFIINKSRTNMLQKTGNFYRVVYIPYFGSIWAPCNTYLICMSVYSSSVYSFCSAQRRNPHICPCIKYYAQEAVFLFI